MAAVSYSIQLNLGQLTRILNSPTGPVLRPLLKTGLRVESEAKRNLGGGPSGPKRIDAGRLRAAGSTQVVYRGSRPAIVVSFATNYARFVHDGTGIYGPKGAPIRPRRAKRLRFKPKGKNRYVYARQVRGMKPNPFLRAAVKTVMARYGAGR